VSDWELGKRSVPAAVVLAAAEVARMDPAELFAAESERITSVDKLIRDLEHVTGGLTPRQRAKLFAVPGKKS